MDNSKAWYLSKTIWLNLIGGLLSSVTVFWPHATFINELISQNIGLIGTVWAGLGLVIRFVTKDKIVLID